MVLPQLSERGQRLLLGAEARELGYGGVSAVAAAFVGIGLHEFFGMVERKGIFLYRNLGLIVGVAIPLSIHAGFETTPGWDLVLMGAAVLALFLLQLARPDSSQTIVGIGTVLFGIFYVSFDYIGLVSGRL